jgi:cytidylate kinase
MINILAFAGLAGTGKSTLAQMVADWYKCQFQSVGTWFREEAARRKVGSQELERLADTDPTVDAYLDGQTLKFAQGQANRFVVIDGRRVPFVLRQAQVSGNLIAEVTTVLMTCGDIRFGRMAEDPKRPRRPVEEVRLKTLEREEITSRRYQRQYGMSLEQILCPDLVIRGRRVYDLHLDTTNERPDECFDMLRNFIQREAA